MGLCAKCDGQTGDSAVQMKSKWGKTQKPAAAIQTRICFPNQTIDSVIIIYNIQNNVGKWVATERESKKEKVIVTVRWLRVKKKKKET